MPVNVEILFVITGEIPLNIDDYEEPQPGPSRQQRRKPCNN